MLKLTVLFLIETWAAIANAQMVTKPGTVAAPGLSFYGDTATGWYHPSASTFAGVTGGVERLRIDSSGDVGIGTASALTTLHVMKNVTGSYEPTTGTTTTGLFRLENSTNNILDIGNGAVASYGSWIQATDKTSLSASYPLLLNPNGGGIAIGTTTPRAALEVNGAIINTVATSLSGSSFDFSQNNIQYTSASCGAMTLNNLKDGGSYTFVVKGGTSGTCAFTCYSGNGTGALTVHYPTDHAATVTSKHTVYTFFVAGTDVYFAWSPGL